MKIFSHSYLFGTEREKEREKEQLKGVILKLSRKTETARETEICVVQSRESHDKQSSVLIQLPTTTVFEI